MERLKSIDEYKALLLQYKQICRGGYSNNYLSLDSVNRYISMQRIYYIADEYVLMFMTDEERYYRLYVQSNAMADVVIRKKDKPILVRNIYKKDKKADALLNFEDKLKQQGFIGYDASVQIVAKPLEMQDCIQKKYERTITFLKKLGVDIRYGKEEHITEIHNLQKKEPLLKEYHFLYETEKEILNNIKNGYYRCAFNESGELCAAQQFSVENGTLQGNWLAVKEEYKVRYGIGTAMAYHSFLYAIEHQIPLYFGWVVRDNIKSLKYHQALGYEISDKMADEWLLK